MTKQTNHMHYGLLLLASFLWSVSFIVSKILVEYSDPIMLTFIRWVVVVLLLIPIVYNKEQLQLPPRAAIIPLLLMGLTGVVLFNIFQFLALAETTASNVGIISSLNIISIAGFSVLFLKERITLLQMTALFTSICGALLIVTKGATDELISYSYNVGDLWMIAAVSVWGIYTVCIKWASRFVSILEATMYSAIFGVLMLAPFTYGKFNVTQFDATFVFGMLYVSVVATVLCMLMWNLGVSQLGPIASGVMINFNPIFTAILAYVLLQETLNCSQLIGCMAIVVGSILYALIKHHQQKTEASLNG